MRTRSLARRMGVALVAVAPMGFAPALAQSPKEVTITNTEANPVPVQERREPFEAEVDFMIPVGQGYGSGSVAIPSGKRLVVEYVSIALSETPRATYLATGRSVSHYFPTVTVSPGSSVGGQTIRVYAETSIELWAELAQINSTGIQVGGSLSGYLVDVP